MKARLVVLAVAAVLAIAGALHHARAQSSRSAAVDPPSLVDAQAVSPGGWWDWH
jgi:hypothetical protein